MPSHGVVAKTDMWFVAMADFAIMPAPTPTVVGGLSGR